MRTLSTALRVESSELFQLPKTRHSIASVSLTGASGAELMLNNWRGRGHQSDGGATCGPNYSSSYKPL